MADDQLVPTDMPETRRTRPPRLWWAGSGWRQFALVGAIAGILALGWTLRGSGLEQKAPPGPKADLAGQLLVATEELRDPRFIQTVIYLVHHDASGAMGLVVNRPMGKVAFRDLLDHLGLDSQGVRGEVRVHYGGPVEGTQGFVLHTSEYANDSTQIVADGIALTSQPEILGAMGTGTGPRLALFAVGYAGWTAGQLEAEIKGGYWITVPADEELVFGDNYDKWERAMARRMFDL